MLLNELLRADLIATSLKAHNKREAIGELVDLLVQTHEISIAARPEVLEAVLAQEDNTPSGMDSGVATPHAITDRVEDLLCAIGISKTGIDFHCVDGGLAHIIVLVVAPKRDFVGEIRAIAGINNLLHLPGMREKILAATSADAIYAAITSEETANTPL